MVDVDQKEPPSYSSDNSKPRPIDQRSSQINQTTPAAGMTGLPMGRINRTRSLNQNLSECLLPAPIPEGWW